ncbi:MAG: twin-arginine translocase TatA/TatE family subunit [Leptospiraceae bacterium]|nr:twin-arginine translocase TatA/TatE family subunit [Leptospiraceae bacterium]
MLPPLAFFNLGPWEIAVILFLALLLFGGKKLPSLAKDLGTGIKEFKKSLTSATTDEPEQPDTTFDKDESRKKSTNKKS